MILDSPPVKGEVFDKGNKPFSHGWIRAFENLWEYVRSLPTTSGGSGSGTVTNTSGSLTAHAVLLGNGGNDLKAGSAMTDGQLLVGRTNQDPIPRTMTGDAQFNASGQLNLINTGAVAGSYTNTNLTVDAKGRITAASSGVSSGGVVQKGAAWSGAGNVVNATTADIVYIECQKSGTITQVSMLGAGGTGSCSVEVWKTNWASALPTAANKISGSTPPAISSGVKYQDATLTGWTTGVTAGDVFAFKLLTNSIFTWLSIVLDIT